ncbi:hypothetical protein APS_1725 [Acetobacter pasteurianus subsp. pasteurianus LMG 1262 = NBRC 106471]|nr:hypothetical protein APS_1725 [Acetobacter pasteurianus subsp. pasteurianus LMG 1262 = NBRC 106471]CCT60777.1 hypothetical protein APA386B_2745 [Acetobacter pasteurianus 386B]
MAYSCLSGVQARLCLVKHRSYPYGAAPVHTLLWYDVF